MSRLVMLPMRDKRQCFSWFRPSGRWFVSDRLRSVGAPRYSAVKNSRSRYLAVVGGLTQESGRLHRNNAVHAHPDIRSSWRPQGGGCWPAVPVAWSAAGVGREGNRQSQPVSQRRLMALSPPRRPPTWRRSAARQGGGQDVAAIEAKCSMGGADDFSESAADATVRVARITQRDIVADGSVVATREESLLPVVDALPLVMAIWSERTI
jgi:hypothetical protein